MEKNCGKAAGGERIETIGNKCFVGRGISCIVAEPSAAPPKAARKETSAQPRNKPEKVNLKFGKIRVAVTGAERIKVKEELNTLVIQIGE